VLAIHQAEARATLTGSASDGLRAALSRIEHEQWIEWTSTLLAMEPGISDERRERWQRLIATDYDDLTDVEQHQDQVYADKVLAALASAPASDGLDAFCEFVLDYCNDPHVTAEARRRLSTTEATE
jgi:hypothetical protein